MAAWRWRRPTRRRSHICWCIKIGVCRVAVALIDHWCRPPQDPPPRIKINCIASQQAPTHPSFTCCLSQIIYCRWTVAVYLHGRKLRNLLCWGFALEGPRLSSALVLTSPSKGASWKWLLGRRTCSRFSTLPSALDRWACHIGLTGHEWHTS